MTIGPQKLMDLNMPKNGKKTSKILQVSNYSENLQITKLWTAKLESEVNFRKLDEEKTNGITRSDIFMHIYVFINIYVICIYI